MESKLRLKISLYKLIFLMAITMLTSLIYSYAGYSPVPAELDYRETPVYNIYRNRVIKPTAKFSIETVKNGSLRSFVDSPEGYELEVPPPKLTTFVGETIRFKDISKVPPGKKIVRYDFQIYGNGIDSGKINQQAIDGIDDIEIPLTPSHKGMINVYLCVQTNDPVPERRIEGWSENGNHQTTGYGPTGKEFPNGMYWYYTWAQVEVLSETPTPTPTTTPTPTITPTATPTPTPTTTPTPTITPTATPIPSPTPTPTPDPVTVSGGEIKVSIVKNDNLDTFSYHPQWKVDTFKRKFIEEGFSFSQLFDLGYSNKSCYSGLNGTVNWDILYNAVDTARKYTVRVEFDWTQTRHREWKVIGSHEEDIMGQDPYGNPVVIGTKTVDDYGWVTVPDPRPVANVDLTVTSAGQIIKSIRYNIASGKDADVSYVGKTQSDTKTFSIRAGETKEFEFEMPLFSNLMNGNTFNDYNNQNAKITAVLSASVPSRTCSCGKRITYRQPGNISATKNIAVDATKIFPHDLHLQK